MISFIFKSGSGNHYSKTFLKRGFIKKRQMKLLPRMQMKWKDVNCKEIMQDTGTFFVSSGQWNFVEWTANEFHSGENVNSTRQKHGEAFDFHSTFLTSVGSCSVPLVKIPALCLVVDVIEQAMFWNQ